MTAKTLLKHLFFPAIGLAYGVVRGVNRIIEMSQTSEVSTAYGLGFVAGIALVWFLIGCMAAAALAYAERTLRRSDRSA